MGIVKHYVEAMKGAITVESTPGKGTTFVVRLPHRLADDAEVLTTGVAAVTSRSFARFRALIAEDNDLNAEIFEELIVFQKKFYEKETGCRRRKFSEHDSESMLLRG